MARRGDRASMREGPLAALFRKTDGEDEPGAEQSAAPEARQEAPAPQQPAAQAPAPEPTPEPPARPHPSLRSDLPEAEPEVERPIPSPQERLRHAFSSELPENVMATPAHTPPTPEFAPRTPRAEAPPQPTYQSPPVYESDPYARSSAHPPGFGQAAPVGHPTIRVIGVGGAGVNAVNRMVEADVEGVEFLAVNTDLQSLQQSSADITLHIGQNLTRGLGSGSNPDLGRG
jgi:cell division protein FtsZ